MPSPLPEIVPRTRATKPHNGGDMALPVVDELRRLAEVYEWYPGISDDLRRLLADLKRRREVA